MSLRRAVEPPDIPLPKIYGGSTLRVLAALVDAFCPNYGIFRHDVGPSVVRMVLTFVPFLPRPLRYGLPFALWVFEYAPFVMGFGRTRFSSLSESEAVRYIRRWEHGRWPMPMIYQAFHSLILVCFYQQPEILAALEVDWPARARELIARRAELVSAVGDRSGSARASAERLVE